MRAPPWELHRISSWSSDRLTGAQPYELPTNAVSITVTVSHSVRWPSSVLSLWCDSGEAVMEQQINPILPREPGGCIIYSQA